MPVEPPAGKSTGSRYRDNGIGLALGSYLTGKDVSALGKAGIQTVGQLADCYSDGSMPCVVLPLKLKERAWEGLSEFLKTLGLKLGDIAQGVSLDESIRAELYQALHTFQGAAQRWEKRRQDGVTDKELGGLIGEEFGNGSGSGVGTVGYYVQGGKKPIFWLGDRVEPKAVLKGKPLLDKARELLNLPWPKAPDKPLAEMNERELDSKFHETYQKETATPAYPRGTWRGCPVSVVPGPLSGAALKKADITTWGELSDYLAGGKDLAELPGVSRKAAQILEVIDEKWATTAEGLAGEAPPWRKEGT